MSFASDQRYILAIARLHDHLIDAAQQLGGWQSINDEFPFRPPDPQVQKLAEAVDALEKKYGKHARSIPKEPAKVLGEGLADADRDRLLAMRRADVISFPEAICLWEIAMKLRDLNRLVVTTGLGSYVAKIEIREIGESAWSVWLWSADAPPFSSRDSIESFAFFQSQPRPTEKKPEFKWTDTIIGVACEAMADWIYHVGQHLENIAGRYGWADVSPAIPVGHEAAVPPEDDTECRIVAPHEGQPIRIDGIPTEPPLWGRDFQLIAELIRAYPRGLSKGQLEDKGFDDPHKRLRAIARKHPGLRDCIRFPGRAGNGGYRLE